MKIRKLIYFTFSLFVGSIITINAFSQTDVDNYKMIYKFNTTKLVDNSRLLEVSFVAKNKKDRKDILPIYEAEIHFYNVTAEQDIELGIAKTDNEGFARLILPEGQPLKLMKKDTSILKPLLKKMVICLLKIRKLRLKTFSSNSILEILTA